jgi:hypothetical protein
VEHPHTRRRHHLLDRNTYAFFVRPGSSNNLLIHLEGGGACWNEGTCGVADPAMATFDPTVAEDEMAAYTAGIFDFENEENPFIDYNFVFVSYCTADVHMGDNVITYGEGDSAVDIHHKGAVNAGAVLDWTYENFSEPESVFLTGCSAGALGSAFHAPGVMANYSDVPVVQLGDSAGGYRGDLTEQFTDWGTVSILPDLPEFEGITASDLSFETLYTAAAANYPANMFSQNNNAADSVQAFFLTLVPDTASLSETLPANLTEIADSSPNFRYYTAWGSEHCVTPLDDFYTYQVDGVRLRDWVADLAAGSPVENVQCTDCETEERYVMPESTPGS